jgi:PAS domain S-box-containing protein
MASRYAAELAAKPSYLQFRIIGVADGGREIVRVERFGIHQAIRIVPDNELEQRGERPYFRETIKLGDSQVYVSPIELNRIGGIAQLPQMPILRVATPIIAPDGTPFGIVVINVDMWPAFERIRQSAQHGSRLYVVNEEGDFLVHADRSREFGFEFGTPHRVNDMFADIPNTIQGDVPFTRMIDKRDGERVGLGVFPLRLADRLRIAVLETVPYHEIMAPAVAVRDSTFLGGFAAMVVAILLATILARTLAKPVVQIIRAIDGFSPATPLKVAPEAMGAPGEIGMLARAFSRMGAEVHDKTVALEREIEERRRLFETSLELILIVDRQGKIVRVSPSSAAILGYLPKEMIGRNAVEFIFPDDLENTRRQMRAARRGGEMRNFETRYVHKEGRPVTLAWTGVWSVPERLHFFFGRDMTDQKQVEESLRNALARQEAIFASALDGIFTLNESGSIESLNAAAEKMFGYSTDAVVRRDIGRLIELGNKEATTSADHLRKLVADGRQSGEFIGRASDGTTFPIELVVAEMPVSGRRMFVLFARDITERKRNERMKDEFVATVSHELRTPLTSISGSLGLLTGGAAGTLPASAMRLLTIAHGNSQRLVRLINDILDIEKIESGKVTFEFERVDMLPLVEHAIEANRGFGESYGVHIRLDPASRDAVVRADPDRIIQVVTNLLSNAVKFSSRDSEVVVAVESRDDLTRVTVRDHGPGIADSFRSRIFEKFAQADASDARQKGGTGLGLSIVKQIMLRHGGEVGFEPAPGGGTIFHIELPKYGAEVSPREIPMQPSGPRVLLCEDDADVAAELSEQLSRLGFVTDSTGTLEGAMRAAKENYYAAILVDLQLPDGDGLGLIAQLRKEPGYRDAPMVVVSANPKRGREDARASGLNVLDWLGKPVDIDRLVRLLNRPAVQSPNARPRILHVDDDHDVLFLVAQSLGSIADVVSADSVESARRALAAHHFDLAVLDVALAEGYGLDLLPDLCGADGHEIPIVMLSAQESPELAARALAILSKSRASIDSLVVTLRRLVEGGSFRSAESVMVKESEKEVA